MDKVDDELIIRGNLAIKVFLRRVEAGLKGGKVEGN